MLAAESAIVHHIHHPKPGGRRALQPKNIIFSDPPFKPKPAKDYNAPPNPIDHFDEKKNPVDPNPGLNPMPMEAMDVSLAEELSAVKRKLERLRIDRENTEKLLIDRIRILDTHMVELELRGEFQKELEIEVDRLYRLKQLKLACMRRSPIRSLREKEMEKTKKNKNKETQSESAKTRESKEKWMGQCSSTESLASSYENTSSSTSASTSNSTINSRKSPIPLRWSLESELSDICS